MEKGESCGGEESAELREVNIRGGLFEGVRDEEEKC